MVPEASLRTTKYGLAPDGEGWFVVSARESRWRDYGPLGLGCNFEGKRRFPQLGFNVNVLQPGQPLGLYHRENAQEGFLVLSGVCTLIVEDEERELRQWDFFHCAPGTAHIIVGAGDGPAVVVAVGARGRRPKGLVYLPSRPASQHGAAVERETRESREAYLPFPPARRVAYSDEMLP